MLFVQVINCCSLSLNSFRVCNMNTQVIQVVICTADAAGNAAIPEGGLEGGVGEGGRGRVQAAGRATLLRFGC